MNLVDSSESSDESVYVMHTVGSMSSAQAAKQWFVTLGFATKTSGTRSFKCQMDSGSTCNLISHRDYLKLTQKEKRSSLKPSRSKLRFYDGTILKPVGQCVITASYQGEGYQLLFQVVNSKQHPLLSAETCRLMGLITLNTQDRVVNTVNEDPVPSPLTRSYITRHYADVFDGLGCLPGKYHLEVDPAVNPVQHLPRKVPVALKSEVMAKIDSMEKAGILAKVTKPTSWISSMVTVKKPGKLRICLDPKDLNKALKRSHYPMPTIEEVLPQLSNAKVFSILDAKDGFWQVMLDEESSYLTTFWTPNGRYRWLRMPFGISTAPEEYQRRQHEILEGLKGISNIADDILVYGCGDTIEEATADHDKHLLAVLGRARENNLKFNEKKMRLRLPEVSYIGHLLTATGVQPDPEKIRAVVEMPRPQDKAGVQRFLGFVNYLARCLAQLSTVCEPLRRLTDKDAIWAWLPQHEQAIEKVKLLVTSAPVLRYYDIKEEITIQCDASDKGLGATILQKGQPVAFASRALSPTEQRYAQIEKECLAIVFSCAKFEQYLLGRDIIAVESDHKPLETIFKKSVLSAPKRLQRMLLYLQKFNLSVHYKRGTEMYIADMLSRAFLKQRGLDDPVSVTEQLIFQVQQEKAISKELEQVNHAEYLRVSEERLHQIQRMTLQDSTLQALTTTVLAGWPDDSSGVPASIREFFGYRDEITVHNGVLYKGSRVIIPGAMQAEMLTRIHASHLGIEACTRKATDVLFWPNMRADIRDTVARCSTCNEYTKRQVKEPMMTHKIPERPWSRVAMDLFSLAHKSYLVVVDYYSDFIEVDMLKDTTAATLVEHCKMHFSRHGTPDTVVSDNGPQFTSEEFSRFATDWEFMHTTSSPYHSQSNGKAESAVKVAKTLFKKAQRADQDPWKSLLDWRNTPTEGMDSSPVQRLMSRRTRTQLPISAQLLKPKVTEGVSDKIKQRRQKAKQRYDQGAHKLPELEIGDAVRVQPLPTVKGSPWRKGVCTDKLSTRSYIVDVDGSKYRRNRRYLRASKENGQDQISGSDEQLEPMMPRTPITPTCKEKTMDRLSMDITTTPTPPRRSSRETKPPKLLEDFVLK